MQQQAREEIDRVLGKREPTLNDRMHLHYTNAVLLEVQRMAAILPITPFHATTRVTTTESSANGTQNNVQNVSIGGHLIPAGAMVAPQISAVLRDAKIWGDADTFRPERHLTSDGKVDNASADMVCC